MLLDNASYKGNLWWNQGIFASSIASLSLYLTKYPYLYIFVPGYYLKIVFGDAAVDLLRENWANRYNRCWMKPKQLRWRVLPLGVNISNASDISLPCFFTFLKHLCSHMCIWMCICIYHLSISICIYSHYSMSQDKDTHIVVQCFVPL